MTDRNSHIALMIISGSKTALIIAVLAALLVAWGPLGLDKPTETVQAVWQKAEAGGHGTNRSVTGMAAPSIPAASAEGPAPSINSGHRLSLAEGPVLAMPEQAPASAGGRVRVPVTFTANGHDISSLVLSVDYDESWLSFDPTDGDEDGIPDAVTFNLPAAFVALTTFDEGDTDGELDVVIFAFAFPPLSLPEGEILSITLDVGSPSSVTEAAVNFSQDPAASFSDASGQSVPGTTDDGSVLITLCPSFVTPPVDVADIMVIATRWRQDVGVGSPYDLDGDGWVTIVDIMLVAVMWGTTCD